MGRRLSHFDFEGTFVAHGLSISFQILGISSSTL